MSKLTHLDENNNAIMVDVSEKDITKRIAVATGKIFMSKEAYEIVMSRTNKKGDVLTISQVAGIMASKKTSELIPLCHNIQLQKVNLTFHPFEGGQFGFEARSEITAVDKTGAEMEALTAVEIGLLTIYDMCKAVDKRMVISDIHLVSKSGGKSGEFNF